MAATQTAPARDLSALPPPPLDRGLPLVGYLPHFMTARNPLLVRLYRKHGPCFCIRIGGDSPVILAGPEMSEFATRDAGRVLHAGPSNLPFVHEFGGTNMMLGSDLEPHFHRRRHVMPMFSAGGVMKMVPRFAEIARELAVSWSDGAPFELLPRLKRLVTRQTGRVMVGRDSEVIHDELCRFFDLAIAVTFARVPRPIINLLGYREVRRKVLDFAQQILDERAAMPVADRQSDQVDLVDLILDAREVDGSPLDAGERRGLVLAPFIGGLDTVSHTLAFLLYEVLRSPDLYARCEREADAIFDGDRVDPARLRGMETIAAAVQETLRFHSVTELGQRVAGETFEFAGYRIEKGTKLLLGFGVGNVVAPHHEKPDRFDIERYLSPRSESAATLGAFGFGPHKCIGARLGEVQLMITLATFLRYSKMQLHPAAAPLRVSRALALKPVGLRVRFWPRQGTGRSAN